MRKAIRFALGEVLHVANARRGSVTDYAFYRLKSEILKKLGTPDGTDFQKIKTMCYSCIGTGRDPEDLACPSCSGSGVWDTRCFELERYRLGRRVFHNPIGRTPCHRQKATIHGRVIHEDYGDLTDECALWLALFFSRPTFRDLMRIRTYRYSRIPYPLLSLKWIYGQAGKLWREIQEQWHHQKTNSQNEQEMPF